MSDLQITSIFSRLNETNMYLISNQLGRAMIIDPADDVGAEACLQSAGLQLDYILLTHEHYDHIVALNQLREKHAVTVVASEICSYGIGVAEINLSKYFNLILDFKNHGEQPEQPIDAYSAKAAEITFKDSFIFSWHGHGVKMWEAPGHSKGSTLILINDQHLFSGDTLSYDFDLITRFPGGSRKAYRQITKPLLDNLPTGLTVYPGHGRQFQLDV